MSTVDERIVQMSFDNRNFETGAQTTLKTLDKLKTSTNFSGSSGGLKSLQNAFDKLSFSGIQNGIDVISNRFTTLGIIGVTALQRITNAAINAGTAMVKSVTLEPIRQGFDEYGLKMGSIQTIMASSGESLQTVNKYLNELNTYADKTIYSFSDMTSSIGKFTNAGVDLNTAVKAIQGISNEAALSGANAQQASHAMYNFAQALSSGSVKLIDWKSIENAQMATVGFKDELIKTAVEVGTLTKTTDGYVSTTTDMNGKVSEAFDSTHHFNDSLSAQWMTTDVLTKTLAKYADETTDLGKKAFAAAQDVKTFNQMMDTLKEAVGSGWAETFENIFGNLDEAKELWTGAAKAISSVLDASAKARNELAKGWKDLGGRNAMIASVSNIWKTFVSILDSIKAAFHDIFPPMTAERLVEITESFQKFTSQVLDFVSGSKSLRSVLRGIFAALDIGKEAISAIWRTVSPIIERFSGVGSTLLDAAGNFGEYIVGIRDSIKANDTFYNAIQTTIAFVSEKLTELKGKFEELTGINLRLPTMDDFTSFVDKAEEFLGIDFHMPTLDDFAGALQKIKDTLAPVGDAFGKAKTAIAGFFESFNLGETGKGVGETLIGALGDGLSKAAGGITIAVPKIIDGVKNLFAAFKETFGAPDFANILAIFNQGVLATILLKLKDFVSGLGKTGEVKEKAKGIKDILESVSESLTNFLDSFVDKVASMYAISGAIAILAGALVVLSMVDHDKLTDALSTMTGLFMEMLGSLAVMDKIAPSNNLMKMAGSMVVIAIAIGLLAGAMKKLASLSFDELSNGLVAVGVLLFALTRTAKSLSKNASNFSISAIGIIGLAASLLILSQAVKVLGQFDQNTLGQGLIAVGILLTELAFFFKTTDLDGMGLFTGVGIVLFASSMLILSSAVDKFGSMNLGQLAKGLVGLGVVLAEIAAFRKLIGNPGGFLVASVAMIAVGAALMIMGQALSKVGDMNWEQLGVGLAGIGGVLLELAIAMNIAKGAVGGAAALVIAAAALLIFAPAVERLGKMSLGEIGKALLVMAGSFVVLGVAGALLQPLVPTILALSAAVVILGVGVMAVGAGLTLLGVGITSLSVSFAAAAAGIIAAINIVLVGLLSLIPSIINVISTTLVSIANVIGVGGAAIIVAIGVLLVAALQTIASVVPAFVEAGITIFLALLKGVASNIGQIVTLVGMIVVEFVLALAQLMPNIINAGVVLIVSFIYGMAKALDEHAEVLVDSILRLGVAIVKIFLLVLEAIAGLIPVIGDKIGGFIDGVVQKIDGIDWTEMGSEISSEFASGVESGQPEVEGAGNGVVNSLGDIFGTLSTSAGQKGTEAMSSFGQSLANGQSTTLGQTDAFGTDMLNSLSLTDGLNNAGYQNMLSFGEGTAMGAGDATAMIEQLGVEIPEGLDLSAEATASGQATIAGYSAGISGETGEVTGGVASMIGQVADSLNSSQTDASSAGKKAGTSYGSGLTAAKAQARSSAAALASQAKDGLNTAPQAFTDAGTGSGQKYASGISSKAPAARSAGASVGNAGSAGVAAGAYDTTPVGRYIGQGLINGMDSKLPSIRAKSRELGREAAANTGPGAGVSSPSKITIGIGQFIGEGLIVGMQNRAKRVEKFGNELGYMAATSISAALDVVNEDVNTSPRITPVLDLTNIQNGVGMLDTLLANRTMTANARVMPVADPANTVELGNDKIVSAISDLRTDISTLGTRMRNLQVVMDSGELVGSITDKVDRSLGIKYA